MSWRWASPLTFSCWLLRIHFRLPDTCRPCISQNFAICWRYSHMLLHANICLVYDKLVKFCHRLPSRQPKPYLKTKLETCSLKPFYLLLHFTHQVQLIFHIICGAKTHSFQVSFCVPGPCQDAICNIQGQVQKGAGGHPLWDSGHWPNGDGAQCAQRKGQLNHPLFWGNCYTLYFPFCLNKHIFLLELQVLCAVPVSNTRVSSILMLPRWKMVTDELTT